MARPREYGAETLRRICCTTSDLGARGEMTAGARERRGAGDRQVGIASVALFGFVRISTNRRVFSEPLAVAEATARVTRWLAQPNVNFLAPATQYLEIAFRLLEQLGTAANLTTRVQLAAHALEHGGEVHFNDGDFGRFEGLRWVDPLAQA